MRRYYVFAIGIFSVFALFFGSAFGQLPDFQLDANSITFSNQTPVEGEEITIWITVKNVGDISPTMNQDLVVDLYEGEPATQPLQILCKDVIMELEPGKTKQVKAQWRPPAGKTEIYAVVNPSGDKHIQESGDRNNIAHAAIVATARTFDAVTAEQIQVSVDKGIAWLETQQGKHSRTCLQCGLENQLILTCVRCGSSLKGLARDFVPGPAWNFGDDSVQETALALQALFAAGYTETHPTVQKGLDYLLSEDWNEFAVYRYAVIVPVLVAAGNPDYRARAQFAVNQLVEKQLPVSEGSEFSDARDYGGWGYGYSADGAHMNMVIYALYVGKRAGLTIPQDTWTRAENWIRRNQTETGGWLYNLVDQGSPWAIGVYGSMTATGLWALRACGVPVEDAQVQKGMDWIKKYWSLTRNPGSNSWLYYYLLSLQRFCDIPPQLATLAGYDWYNEISGMMVAEQEPDGRWRGADGDFLATCFAVMTLSHALVGPSEPNIGVVPQSLRFSPPAPRAGEATRLSATLRNTGTPFENILNVTFYADDVAIKTTQVLWTSTLDESTVSVDWAPPEEGEMEISVQVDFEDADESDNTASVPLTVHSKSTAATDAELASIRKIGEGIYQLGNVVCDTNKREITFPGEINATSEETILEFFACGNLGKTYESLLMIDAEPMQIFVALGLLEMEPGMNHLTAQGDPREPKGDTAEIWVQWKRQDEVVLHRAEELVWNAFTEQPMQKTPWIFSGGRLINNQLTAQKFHNVIAVYRDPDSLFNHALPGGTDDRTYRANTDLVPPKGTKVKIIIRPL